MEPVKCTPDIVYQYGNIGLLNQLIPSIPTQSNGPSGSGGAQKSEIQKQLDCAKQVVSKLFDMTGLSKLASAIGVSVGNGNWISFGLDKVVTWDDLDTLNTTAGEVGTRFAKDILNANGGARSTSSPSLHLMGLNANLANAGVPGYGHVDAHFWMDSPLGHTAEFGLSKTAPPCDLLAILQKN